MNSSDKTNPLFGHNMSEVERDFKRLKVDEKEKQSAAKPKSDHSFNYFSLKSSPYSPKLSSSDKRQSINGFRRQRLHLPNKLRTVSDIPSKTRSNEEPKHFVAKDYRDFSELRISCDRNTHKEKSKHLYFNKDFKFDSNHWRNTSDKHFERRHRSLDHNSRTESKDSYLKKLRFNEDKSCARQAMDAQCDASADELAAYLDDTLFLPRKMSFMAEMMYT